MKRQLLGIFLILFTVWPLVQFGLVRHYGVNPWKLMGFAMYSAPGPMDTIRLVRIDAQGSNHGMNFQAYSPEEQNAVDLFRNKRINLGKLHTPDRLADALFEIHPDAAGFVVVVLSLRLNPSTATLDPSADSLVYWRDGRNQAHEVTGLGSVPARLR